MLFFIKIFLVDNHYNSTKLMLAKNRNLNHIERNIIISNIYTIENNHYNFDAVYFDIYDAFQREEELINKYLISKITIYFSKGEHFFIISPEFENNNKIYTFFKNLNTTIIIQPLLCVIVNLTDLCVEKNEKPIIYFKSSALIIFIAYRMEIYYITFNFIETLYPYSFEKNSCLFRKNQRCCSNADLIKDQSYCNIFNKNISEELLINTLQKAIFVIEGLANQEVQFLIKFCYFEQFIILEPSNQIFNSLILITCSFAILEISNVDISEVFTFRPLIDIDFRKTTIDKNSLSIIIANSSFNNFNKYRIKLNFSSAAKNALF